MNSTLTVDELGAVLSGALVEAGLQVQACDLARAEGILNGPVLAVRLPIRPGAGIEVAVAALDRASDEGSDQLVQAMAQAVVGPVQHLVDGDASLDALPALDAVLRSFDAPVEAALVLRGGVPVGALMWAVDRRQSAPVMPGDHGAAAFPTHGATLGGSVAPAVHPSFGAPPAAGMALLKDVHLDVSVELGRTDMTVAEVLELAVGAVVELDRAARAPVDIRVNGTLLARGEVVVVDDEYAVRVTEIIDPASGLGS